MFYNFENSLAERGFTAVCGIDEAGCGPLAGPVYAAAVILDPNDPIEGLNDSKKLTEKKREALFPEIQKRARAWAIASASAREIDEINILQARLLAMRRAVELLEQLLGQAGFVQVRCYGEDRKSAPTEADGRVFFVCRKEMESEGEAE